MSQPTSRVWPCLPSSKVVYRCYSSCDTTAWQPCFYRTFADYRHSFFSWQILYQEWSLFFHLSVNEAWCVDLLIVFLIRCFGTSDVVPATHIEKGMNWWWECNLLLRITISRTLAMSLTITMLLDKESSSDKLNRNGDF